MIGILCQHRSGHSAYELYLADQLKLPIQKELDINVDDKDQYFENLPSQAIFSMMPFEQCYEYMKKYHNVDWRIFVRKDVITQCYSFLYVNKTLVSRGKQTEIVDADISLVDYFFQCWHIINNIKVKNEYPVFYYEDFEMPNNGLIKDYNNYSNLIRNVSEINKRIKKYTDEINFNYP